MAPRFLSDGSLERPATITVLHNGAFLAEGSVEEGRANAEVQRVYLRE